jgi:hypothetical protein
VRPLGGDAATAHQQTRLRTLRDLDSAALKLAKGWRLLLQDTTSTRDWREHVFEMVPQADIEVAMNKVETLARPDASSQILCSDAGQGGAACTFAR